MERSLLSNFCYPEGPVSRPLHRFDAPAAAGAGAVLLWALACARWFDAAVPFRPAWLSAVPPAVLGLPALGLGALWARSRWGALWGTMPPGAGGGLLLVVALAALFRLPLAWWGAAGYMSGDECLTGIVAIHIREGIDHHVFLPQLPYNGTLRAHLAAPLSLLVDTPRAFVLLSIPVYALFVAGVYRLALLVRAAAAVPAGLYAAFAPTFVTQYGLMSDVYLEVLAFGTWALLLAARWGRERDSRPVLAVGIGTLLGLGFWCHMLAVVPAAAVGLTLLLADARRALRALPRLASGFAIGYLPGLLWNAANGWESFLYFVPGVARGMTTSASSAAGPGFLGRALDMIEMQWPTLLGYDPGYPAPVDALLYTTGLLAAAATVYALAAAARDVVGGARDARLALLLLALVNVMVALTAVRYIAGDPRYLLPAMTTVSVLLPDALARGSRRWLLAGLVAFGALGTLAQAAGKIDADARWRGFVAELSREGVRHCYTDFWLASKVNFLSEGRTVCSSKLGPTRTEYFFEYRRRVDEAPEAALIAVNAANAEKLERRLERLGVRYERRDLMKPVLLRLSRKVDPMELFPGQEFGLR